MGVNKQSARIKHHTSTTTGTFTVPSSEDFTDGSWDKWDLAKSEIGVNEFDETVSIRIGANVYDFYTTAAPITSSNIGNSDLTISDATRKLNLDGDTSSESFGIYNNAGTLGRFVVKGDGSMESRVGGSTAWFDMKNSGGTSVVQIGVANNLGILNCHGQFSSDGSTDGRVPSAGVGGKGKFAVGRLANSTWLPFESSTNVLSIFNGTAPTLTGTDMIQLYSADQTAGNACLHILTENGSLIKVYQETTAVSSATFVANTSGISDDTATWGGYTMGQVVQALQNIGLLQ